MKEGGEKTMRYENERQYRKETSLKNDTKCQNQWTRNTFNTSIEEPGINESGKSDRSHVVL